MNYPQKSPPPRDSGAGVVPIVVSVLLLVLLLGAGVIGAAFWIFSPRTDEAFAPAVEKLESTVDEDSAHVEAERRIESRLTAAGMMSDHSHRNDVYARIAEDAAQEGLSDPALSTLHRINNVPQRDLAALAVVRALDEREREDEALRAAQMIQDLRLRDEALRGIAGGQWPEGEAVDAVAEFQE